MSANFFKQFGPVLPANLYFAAVPYYAGDAVNTAATNAAIATLTTSLAAQNAKPDMIQISAWDPAMVVVDALRKLGPNATAAQLHTYLNGLRGWTGVNGSYDYRTNPQRGVGESNVVMVRWDQQQNKGIAVSKLGGAPLPK
jgi:branched-chain amino acid transport system substrate-binding protein